MSNAKRYTPEFSLGTQKAKKGLLLYFFLTPVFIAVILALIAQNIPAFILNTIAFVLFYGTAKFNTIGLRNEFEYEQKSLTKAPKHPFKTYSAILLGVATLFTAFVAGEKSIFIALFLAVIAMLGYYLHYGLDPTKDKLENIGDISAELVLKTLEEANAKISTVETHLKKGLNDLELESKLKLAIEKSKSIIQAIQEDPKDIRVARKFLMVYLDGLEKVTSSYSSMEAEDIQGETKEKLHTLLEDVEKRFDKELQRLKQNNAFDLDVNIDVLHQQIKN
jgi:5-bromo-4-chloroindolyl phosphate hydrolysis protein